MRTAIILLAGFAGWAVCLAIAKLVGRSSPAAVNTATVAFVVLWFLAAAANMWVGVTKAGYSFGEELPIFLLIFLLPVAVAIFVRWKFL